MLRVLRRMLLKFPLDGSFSSLIRSMSALTVYEQQLASTARHDALEIRRMTHDKPSDAQMGPHHLDLIAYLLLVLLQRIPAIPKGSINAVDVVLVLRKVMRHPDRFEWRVDGFGEERTTYGIDALYRILSA
jgi:hypothetical protein